jgi:hypothetical protein
LVPLNLPLTPPASYWQGDANEMAGVKNILIIVNAAVVNRLDAWPDGKYGEK